MNIYIDSDYKCHLTDDGTRRGFDVAFFDGKCSKFIEGYRYIPAGEKWVKPNGVFFKGEMIAPWRDYDILAELQEQYEETQAELADKQAALDAIYAGVTE